MKTIISTCWFIGIAATVLVTLSGVVYVLDICGLWSRITGPRCLDFKHALDWTAAALLCLFGLTMGIGVLTGLIGDR